jgi:serine/threonine protein kinase
MIGSTVAHFKIIEKLGEGGMGAVYKAEDIELKRFVALKFLLEKFTESRGARERFRNEARATSPLDHPNICAIHEICETESGQLYFAMAYCEGETIEKKIKKGPLKLKEALDYAIQIALGLSEAHGRGIVHRDIKPSNLMVTKNDVVKILDFGISKVRHVDLHTKTGAVFGSLWYMSPEQATGTTLDQRTDIWSFGVSLYEMLTGRTPFQGEHEGTILNGILNEEAPLMSDLCEDIPMELERLVGKALAKNPDERYQQVDDMLADLQRLRGELVKSEFYPAQQIVIAVADFVNYTDEEELDSLSGLLITALEQSHRLSVLTRARMFDLLKQMPGFDSAQIENIVNINESLAKKICNYTQLNALAVATTRKFDEVYTVELKVIDPILDEHLFAAVERGKNKASIPTMIDRLSQKTQNELRIEDRHKTRPTPGVEDVTTSNLEAYYHFHKGMDSWYKLQEEQAEEELRKAIAIDPTFGLPYALLACIYIGTPEEHLAKEPLSKALKYLDRTPERERYLIQAINAYFEEGSDAAIAALRRMEPVYPDDKRMYFGLGYFHLQSGNYENARRYFNLTLELDPTFAMATQFLSEIPDTVSKQKRPR